MFKIGSVLSGLCICLFAVYLGNTFYTLYNLFNPELCTPGDSHQCIYPMVDKTTGKWPTAALYIRVSPNKDPFDRESLEVYKNKNLNVYEELDANIELKLSQKLKKNLKNLQMHAILLPGEYRLENPQQVPESLIQSTKLTTMKVPVAATFNLMAGEKDKEAVKVAETSTEKVPHLTSKVYVTVVEDALILPLSNLPSEIIRFLRLEKIDGKHFYHPIFTVDEMSSRVKDLLEIKPENETLYFTVNYRPLSVGKLRLIINGQASFGQFKRLGFSEKDFDEVKGIFTDTNFYFLTLTVFISTVHLLLDVLSFKNDISFWKNRDSMVGLSTKTLVWRCVSQTIIFFYLFDEKTSLLVLAPSGFGVLIEIWKLTKALKVEWSFNYGVPWPRVGTKISAAEQRTNELDTEAMGHLSKLMIPLCIAGAAYSLMYVPHKSWVSWIINCLANGVYAFGFLFMLPQLFLNYKLKSVAHLPWRAFMYKAFNTFIDDMFVFIISMPTAHRVACFRDDIVFLIYLYQRYLYPVDKARVNEYGQAFDEDAEQDQAVKETTETKKEQ